MEFSMCVYKQAANLTETKAANSTPREPNGILISRQPPIALSSGVKRDSSSFNSDMGGTTHSLENYCISEKQKFQNTVKEEQLMAWKITASVRSKNFKTQLKKK